MSKKPNHMNLQNITKFIDDESDNKEVLVSVNPTTMVVKIAYIAEEEGLKDEHKECELETARTTKKKKKEKEDEVNIYGLNEILTMYKQDVNAVISISELKRVLDNMGYKCSEAETKIMKKYADVDGDGLLNLTDFVNLMLYVFLRIEDTEDDIVESFKTFDYGDTGFITAGEMRRVLSNLGDKLTDAETDSFIQKGDLDRDGNINCGEFTKKMLDQSNEYDRKNKLKI